MDPGDVLAGRFELGPRASSGGMGAVYHARDRSSGAPVAIKVLHEHTAHEAARFLREGQLLAQLQHPAIVRYVGHGTTRDGSVFLAMEWLEGEDLGRRLAAGPLSVVQAAQLGQQAAEALGVAHAAGIIHRDLKPSNLFLVGGSLDHIKLLDFGIARPAMPGHSITATGVVLGTPGYMAPEQARSAKRVDPRADVFSLGCVLYRCLAGRDPFGSGNAMAVLLRVVLEEPPRLDMLSPAVPKMFAEVVARMMAKAPEDRPVDGTAVAVALGRLRPELGAAASSPVAATPRPVPGPPAGTQRGLGPLPVPAARPSAEPTAAVVHGPAMDAAPALAARVGAATAPSPAAAPRGADAQAWARRAPPTPPGAAPPPEGVPAPRASVPGLTTAEQRAVCLLLARPGAGDVAALAGAGSPALAGSDADRLHSTAGRSSPGHALEPLFSSVARHGGRLDRLADDSLLVTFPRGASAGQPAPAPPARVVATDEAARAARCALALHPLLAYGPMALVAGSRVDPDHATIEEAIDRGVQLLDRPLARGIWVDDTMAGLLDLRFEVVAQAEGLLLRAERKSERVGRTLLGKVVPCVGRDSELSALLEQIAECATGRGARAVVVTGAPGVGKSRVRDELARIVARRGELLQMWLARGEPTAAGAPFGMMSAALAGAMGIVEGEGVEARQHKLWARLSRSLRGEDRMRVALFLGELVGAAFPDDRDVQLQAARRDMRLMGDQIRRACQDFVRAECAAMPLLFVLEDLQWGDSPTVTLLETLLRNIPRSPLMVLGLGRPEVRDRFPSLLSAPSTHIIELGALPRGARVEIARVALGDGPGLGELERIAERSGGNAFYLEELVRAVANGKGDELPASVLAMVQARLESLQPSERHVLRAAAVFGQRWVPAGLRELVGDPYSVEQVTALLELLAGAELVVRSSEGAAGVEYAFAQDPVRQAAYSMLTAADRVLGHRLAGDWLERTGRGDALMLAEHFEHGQEPARAIGWYVRAAEQALRGDDLDAALERAERGVACGAKAEELGALRLVQAEALGWRGELRAAESRAAEAMKLLDSASPRWWAAAAELAGACGQLGVQPQLGSLALELAAALGDEPPTLAAARALSAAAVQLLWAGEIELADRLLEQLDRAVDASNGDPATVAHVFRACGARAMIDGDVAAGLELTRMVMKCSELVGNLREACIQRGNCGAAYMELGAWSEAEGELVASLETADRLGLETVSAHAKLNLCPTLGRQGRLEEARSLGLEALAAFKLEANPRLESTAHVYLAEALTLAGDLVAAKRHARAAVDVAPPGPSTAFALAACARAELVAGNAREALACAEQARTLLGSVGGMDEGEAMLRLVWAEALAANGRHDEARRAIAEARDRLLERADKIASVEWRRSFLERMGENARTLTLSRVWLGEPSDERMGKG